ncbi:formin-like protein 8 [Iris pallida]|uniref:Formin-like protein 8 n=1 Tax=Iris pallida TaxID=29817 RepID=A0AAX6IDC0_IRIPA|nr:formin-like protein 8 [Iris pallida]
MAPSGLMMISWNPSSVMQRATGKRTRAPQILSSAHPPEAEPGLPARPPQVPELRHRDPLSGRRPPGDPRRPPGGTRARPRRAGEAVEDRPDRGRGEQDRRIRGRPVHARGRGVLPLPPPPGGPLPLRPPPRDALPVGLRGRDPPHEAVPPDPRARLPGAQVPRPVPEAAGGHSESRQPHERRHREGGRQGFQPDCTLQALGREERGRKDDAPPLRGRRGRPPRREAAMRPQPQRQPQ